MPPQGLEASEIETAVVVLHYLVSHGFGKAVKAFRRDAKQLLKPVRSVPAGIRPLPNIIVEYVALKEAAIRRDNYLRRNPTLQEIDNVIARHSECQNSAQELAAQCQRPVEGPIITLDLSETQEAAEETGADEVNKAALDDNSQHFPAESSPAAEAMQPRLTPRKLLRKAAPKRKRLGSLQAEAQGDVGSDLLNQPVNERMLEQLLAGEWQGRFAEGLASCINSHLGPHEQQGIDVGMCGIADMAPFSQQQALDETAMINWVSALTEEPNMAALLEPIVAPELESQSARRGSKGEPLQIQIRSAAPLESNNAEPPLVSCGLAHAPSESNRAQGGKEGPEHAWQPTKDMQPGRPEVPDCVQHNTSSMPRDARDADHCRQQGQPGDFASHAEASAPPSVLQGEPFLHAWSPQPEAQYGSPDAHQHEEPESDCDFLDDCDSDDDIQVRPMDRIALLSSLIGSGAADDAIEGLVASLKY